MTERLLEGRRVLIVEDQYLIAEEMRRAVLALGGEVVGPCPTIEAAMETLKETAVQFALLDVNVQGEEVARVTDELAARGVPFAFATGYDQWAIPPQHHDRVRIEKPVTREALREAIERALQK
ncbi:MAG TPA: response regulator [Caulobacteraceae bacterium]|nr:response regulator [Caulobacteraceae bacterium]